MLCVRVVGWSSLNRLWCLELPHVRIPGPEIAKSVKREPDFWDSISPQAWWHILVNSTLGLQPAEEGFSLKIIWLAANTKGIARGRQFPCIPPEGGISSSARANYFVPNLFFLWVTRGPLLEDWRSPEWWGGWRGKWRKEVTEHRDDPHVSVVDF